VILHLLSEFVHGSSILRVKDALIDVPFYVLIIYMVHSWSNFLAIIELEKYFKIGRIRLASNEFLRVKEILHKKRGKYFRLES
jgi:hypothetical protein